MDIEQRGLVRLRREMDAPETHQRIADDQIDFWPIDLLAYRPHPLLENLGAL